MFAKVQMSKVINDIHFQLCPDFSPETVDLVLTLIHNGQVIIDSDFELSAVLSFSFVSESEYRIWKWNGSSALAVSFKLCNIRGCGLMVSVLNFYSVCIMLNSTVVKRTKINEKEVLGVL